MKCCQNYLHSTLFKIELLSREGNIGQNTHTLTSKMEWSGMVQSGINIFLPPIFRHPNPNTHEPPPPKNKFTIRFNW